MKRLNRTYRIFIAVLMLFTISSFIIVAAENEHGTLVANHLKSQFVVFNFYDKIH